MRNSIGAFGDSIMKGIIFNEQKGRYTVIKNSFAYLFAKNTGWHIDNYSKFGCTIAKGCRQIEKAAEKLRSYRITALEFGGNDCDYNWGSISEKPDDYHQANTPITDFKRMYAGIIDRLKNEGCLPVILSLPPLNAQRYFSWVSRGLNKDNILKWLGDVEHIYRWHERYNLAIIELAGTKNVPLINIREAFLERRDCHSLYCLDGIHPNEAGHLLIYNTVKSYLEKTKFNLALSK
jgi:acyl-CoA thioesterase-1